MIKKELIKKFAQKIDDLLDWKKWIPNAIIANLAELGDGYVLSYGLGFLNEKYGELIPEQYVDEIEQAMQCFIDGDYLGMLNVIPASLDEVIRIEAFDDDFQAAWLASNFKAALLFAKWAAERKIQKQKQIQ